jgi:Domain of unknown function (DUF5666)
LKKPLTIAALGVTGVFAVGFAAGQISGITGSSAATKQQPSDSRTFGPGEFFGRHAMGRFAYGGMERFTSPLAFGTVTAIHGNTITIKSDANPGFAPPDVKATVNTILLTGTTIIHTGRGQTGSASSIKVGERIAATGKLSSDGKTLTASGVRARTMGPRQGLRVAFGPIAFGPHVDGKVTAVNGNTITIQPDANRHAGSREYQSVTTITLTGGTTYLAGPGAKADAASIKVGSFILAMGTLSTDGKTLTAKQVLIGVGMGHVFGHGDRFGPGMGFGPPQGSMTPPNWR